MHPRIAVTGSVAILLTSLALARIIHEGFVNNPGLPDEQPFPPATGGYLVVGGPGTHPPGWVRCHRAPATTDPSRTADHTGFYLARIVRERCSRIMRASPSAMSARLWSGR